VYRAFPREKESVSSVAKTRAGDGQQEAKRHRFLVLDGVRGLAILAVLVTHGSYAIENRYAVRLFQLGYMGVYLFFVLSGFLITGILLQTKAAVNRASSFYARRVLRIFPIYYLMLGIALAAQAHWAWVAAEAEMPNWLSRLPYLLYFVNFIPLWHHGTAHQTLLQHFWSLAVEEQFYFVWPLVVWHVSTRTVTRICGAALCVALAFRIGAGMYFGFGVWLFMLPISRADGLFVGSALAALLALNYQPSKRLLAGTGTAATLALLLVFALGRVQIYFGGPLMSTFGFTAVAVLCGVLISWSLQSNGGLLSTIFEARWIRNLGRYSYGMYVFHLPLFYLFDHLAHERLGIHFPLSGFYSALYLGGMIVATYAVAWISFHFFEQRFLQLKDRFDPRFSAAGRTRTTDALPEMEAAS
jgi:peptidoglycan/LPS O-acetylase OafA/YrhL